MSEQLLPCPFCGCANPPVMQGNGIGDNWLECQECGASTRLREDGAGSYEDWNRRPTCEWTKDPDDEYMPDTWDSACGEKWTFNDGGPVENSVRFCQGCGKTVKLAGAPTTKDTGGEG